MQLHRRFRQRLRGGAEAHDLRSQRGMLALRGHAAGHVADERAEPKQKSARMRSVTKPKKRLGTKRRQK